VFRICNLHPEFGYIDTPRFRRGFIAFVVCGLVAGTGGIAMFKADSEPDPMRAMAFAPVEALSSSARLTPAAMAARNSDKFSEVGAINPRCAEHLKSDCIAGRIRRARSIPALNERPAIAAAPIGHRVDPAVLPPEPAAPVVAVQPKDADTPVPAEMPAVATLAEDAESATPAESPSAVPAPPASLPAVVSTKTRGRHREPAQRREREHREYASTPRYYSNRQVYQAVGYARLW
jgi:hypothetical protein